MIREVKIEKRTQFVFNTKNQYGFKININHPLMSEKFADFQKANNIGRHDMTDEKRLEFEEIMLNSGYFQKCLKQELKQYGSGYRQAMTAAGIEIKE